MDKGHEDLLLNALRQLEDKVQAIEELQAGSLVDERKRHVAVFSDAQTSRMEDLFARALVVLLASDAFTGAVNRILKENVGNQAVRFLLWAIGGFAAGALAVWIKVKGGGGFSDG